jgi:hypothetical protein
MTMMLRSVRNSNPTEYGLPRETLHPRWTVPQPALLRRAEVGRLDTDAALELLTAQSAIAS